MIEKKTFLNQLTSYLSGTVANKLISIATFFLSRRFMGPTQTGIWSLIQIFMKYASFLNLGIGSAAKLEIPYAIGKKDLQRSEEIKNVFFTFNIFLSLLISVIFISSAILLKFNLSKEMFVSLLLAGVLIIFVRFQGLLTSLLRAYKKFKILSRQLVLSSIVNALFVIYFSYKFKIYGFFLAVFLTTLFNIGFMYLNHLFKFKIYWNWKHVKSLMIYGLPLVALSILNTIFVTIDQIFVSKYLGLEALGFYSIAIVTYRSVTDLPNAVGIVLSPNFQEHYGKSNSKKDFKDYLNTFSSTSSLFFPGIILISSVLVEPFIQLALPQFTSSIKPCQILILGAFFFSVNQGYWHYMTTIRKHIKLFPIIGVCLVVAILINYQVIRMGYGISGIAIGTVVVLGLKFLLTFLLSMRYIEDLQSCIWQLLKIIISFLSIIIVLVVFENIFPLTSGASYWQNLLSKIFIVALLYVPVIIYANKKYKIWGMITKTNE